MAGATTEILNDDLRLLRDEVHGMDLDLREQVTKINGITAGIRYPRILILASLLSGVCWGASLTTRVDGMTEQFRAINVRFDQLEPKVEKLEIKVDRLEVTVDKIEATVGKLEAKVDTLQTHLDKIEAMLIKALDKPNVKPEARP